MLLLPFYLASWNKDLTWLSPFILEVMAGNGCAVSCVHSAQAVIVACPFVRGSLCLSVGANCKINSKRNKA